MFPLWTHETAENLCQQYQFSKASICTVRSPVRGVIMESLSLAKTTKSFISSLWNSEYESLRLGFAGAINWHTKLLLLLALGFGIPRQQCHMVKPWQNIHDGLMAPEQLKSVVQIRADEIEFMLRSISRGIVDSGPMETPQEINTLLWIYTSNLASQMMLSKRYFLHESGEEGDEAKEFRRFMETFNRLTRTDFPAEILSFLRWFDIGELQRHAASMSPVV